MFKALLLATWYDLSDVMLAEAFSDRASFRRFCGFAREEETPERTAFVRFRRQLVEHGLAQSLFEAIARDLERKGAKVRKGTLSDATVIGSASKGDKDAWAKHMSRTPAHGYKAHLAGLIRAVETTPANAADVSVAPSLTPDRPGEVYADKAYDAPSVAAAIKAKGGIPRLLRKGFRWLKAASLEGYNRPLQKIRSRIEKIFGTWKRSYHFRAMRWIGLAKAKLQAHLAVIAYNIKRYWRLQCA